MAYQNDITEHLGLPLPYGANPLSHDVQRLRDLGSLVDTALANLRLLVETKADQEATVAALAALQAAINSLGAARVQSVNSKSGVNITLMRDDIKLGPANGPSAVAVAYDTSGRVSTVTETLDGKPAVATITYNASGQVQTVVTSYNGRKRTETLTYTSGRLTSTTATEAAA